jgi:hypothetical protein
MKPLLDATHAVTSITTRSFLLITVGSGRVAEADAATVFAVVTGGKAYSVTGAALQCWIVGKGSSLNGPKRQLYWRGQALIGRFVAYVLA